MTRPTSFWNTPARRRLTRPALETLEDRLAPAVVGYYDMAHDQGVDDQIPPITATGNTAVRILDPTASELAGLDVLFVQNPYNGYRQEYLDHRADIEAAVYGGMTLIIHDRYVDTAENILPGGGGFDVIRDFSDKLNIDVLDNTTVLTNGPGGVIDDASLDNGNNSNHGYAVASSLPTDARLLLSTSDPTHVVTFSYAYGDGNVIYSTIPLDYYLYNTGANTNFSVTYARNVIAYGVGLHNLPPVAEDVALTTGEDVPLSGTLSATDPNGDPLTYSLDSGPAHGSVTITDTATGAFTYTPAANFNGIDSFDFRASDGELEDSATVDITVTAGNDPPIVNAGDDQSGNEGDTFSFPGSAQDVDGDTLLYTWTFDDGSDPVVGQNVSHTFTDNRVYTVTLTVDDGHGGVVSDTLKVTVFNVAPTPSINSISTPRLEATTLNLVGSATDPGGSHDTLTFAWKVFKGTATTPFALGSGVDLTHFSFTPDDNGNYKIVLTVSDEDGDSAMAEQTVTIDNVAPTVATDQAAITVNEGALASNTGTFADPGNDTVNLTASVGTVIDTGNGTWSWSFGTSDGPDNSQTVTITATDSDGASSSTTFALTVNNVAPTAGAITGLTQDPMPVSSSITATLTFSDPGSADTHTVKWDWGDGSTTTVENASGSGVDTNHLYNAAGVYTVKATVTDDDGGISNQSTFQYVVVYDPSAGFVTGGGWIYSPEGAYVADTSLTGKANFGFVSRYKKGQSTPDGNTEFQFKVADFKFTSTSYDWLVIAGTKAMYKGVGTINGAGNYGFQLTARDAEATPNSDDHDMFRIKIWDMNNGDAVVYDNQMGCADDADPTTALGGGSIVLHAPDALQAASLATGSPATAGLTSEQLAPIVAEALARWEAAGLSPEQMELLRGVQIVIGDLGSSYLGTQYTNTIWIDDDAAGWGWFVDATPWDDSEFTTPGDQGEQGHMDLLTVVMHEMGHVLGLEDLNPAAYQGDLMAATLTSGTRRLPVTGQVTEAVSLPAPDGTASGFANDWIFGVVTQDRGTGSTPPAGDTLALDSLMSELDPGPQGDVFAGSQQGA